MSIHWSSLGSGSGDSAAHEHVFVDKVNLRRPRRRMPVDAFVVVGWTLIVVKCVFASMAIRHWSIPIADFYVWGPSFMFGALCTGLYLFREDR